VEVRSDVLVRPDGTRGRAALAAAANAALKSEDVVSKLTASGFGPLGGSPEEFAHMRPGLFRASRIAFSSSAAIGGLPSLLHSLLALALVLGVSSTRALAASLGGYQDGRAAPIDEVTALSSSNAPD
jgi:hypothetical protein